MGAQPVTIRMVSVGRGIVALSPLPGLTGQGGDDFAHIAGLMPSFVVSIVTEQELEAQGVSNLGTRLQDTGARWYWLQVAQGQALDAQTDAIWSEIGPNLHRALNGGGRILLHGLAGARAVMVAYRLMLEAGQAPAQALDRLHRVWPQMPLRPAQAHWAENQQINTAIFMRHKGA